MSITVTITAGDYINGGMHGVLSKLRQGGIPVRLSHGTDLRLCQVWTGDKCIGYGQLDWVQDSHTQDTTFTYTPPQVAADPNVIDVEAREVSDALRLDNEQ